MIVILFILATAFGMVGCLDSSTGGGGSGGGSSGSGGYNDDDEDDNEDESVVKLNSEKADDFFSGMLIMYDAGHNGEFYDEATGKNQKFVDLLDREITTFTTHLMFALNVMYGDNATVSSDDIDIDLLALNTTIKDLWGGISGLMVNSSTILSDSLGSEGSCVLNTNNLEQEKEALASSISLVAGMGTNPLGIYNQFNFNNAIKGGYVYEQTTNNEENGNGEVVQGKGKFTEEINTANAWSLDITNSTYNETIRNAIANIVATGKYEQSSLNGSYDEALEKIEYLGFSPNDLANIAKYVCENVIGSAYTIDEGIRQSISTGYVDVKGSSEDEDLYPTAKNTHYYKAYNFAVQILVERMAYVTTEGLYTTSTDYESAPESSKILTYIVMPRTAIAIRKCSEVFDSTETEDDAFDEDGMYDENGNVNLKYEPVLSYVKLKQIVFLPKLSLSVLLKYVQELQDEYGSNYSSYYDPRFQVQAINIGLNGTIFSEESRFICLPTFTISAEGEIVYSDKCKIDGADDPDLDVEAYHDEYSFELDYIYNAGKDEASFNIGDAMNGKKFSNYDGVAVFDEDDKPSSEYFHKDGLLGDYTLILNKGASYDEESKAIYQINTDDNGNFKFTFNGGQNFLQIDFSYFDLDSGDIYKNETAIKIETQIIDLVTLSIFT